MLKKLFVAAFLAGVFTVGLGGCAPWAGDSHADDNSLPSEVSLVHYQQLRPKVSIGLHAAPRDLGIHPLQIMVHIANVTAEPLHLEYKTWFVDERGASIDDPGIWIPFVLDSVQSKELYIKSDTAGAKSFRIMFRERLINQG